MNKIENYLSNRKGILYLEECSALDLARKFGTPLYVYSEARISENYQRLFNAFSRHYKKFRIHYSIKANDSLAILKILQKLGSAADCSSPAEIYLAKKAGIKVLIYSGIYYDSNDLQYGIKNNVKINMDNADKLKLLSDSGVREICFRVNPGIGNGKFNQIVTSGKEAKFGMIEQALLDAYKKAKNLGFQKFGIHMMTGSCIIEGDYFEKITGVLMDIAGKISKEAGILFDYIDIGGGFGIPYEPGEKELDIEKVASNVIKVFREKLKEYDLGEPWLLVEPGRYIEGDTAVLLTKVTSIKKRPKHFIGIDSGMNTLIRPMLYHAYHEILLANNLNAEKKDKIDIVGQICESTDIFTKDRIMPEIKENDILAILNAGAYGFSMSSTYGCKPRPAEVLVSANNVDLIRKRQEIQDLAETQIVPERLR